MHATLLRQEPAPPTIQLGWSCCKAYYYYYYHYYLFTFSKVVTAAGGVAFLDGDALWWFYSENGRPVRGRWSGRCLGCGVFRTADGRVRCPAGSFFSEGSCRQVTHHHHCIINRRPHGAEARVF